MQTATFSQYAQKMTGTLVERPAVLPEAAELRPATGGEAYFADSELYQIRKEYQAEVICHPQTKAGFAQLQARLIDELGDVLLAAFGKTRDDAETFLSGEKFTKVAVHVDYLVVIRREGKPVAFGAANYITPFLLYFNSLMVMPKYHRVGLGFYIAALLWKYAIPESQQFGYLEPDIICRTHNRAIATALIRVLRDGHFSSEQSASAYAKMLFKKTDEHLHCATDECGIARNVYPAGLPEGNKTTDLRVLNAFAEVGPKDGLYLTGKLDQGYINGILDAHARPLNARCEREAVAA